jgi:site-specific DNA-methyltransferase (adenine-specific)
VKPYYESGGITIYHGDCREILPQVQGAAVISDPPYGVGVKYGPSYSDKRSDGYWDWMREVVSLMRGSAPVVAFTHRNAALKELREYDWVAVWHKPGSFGARIGNSPVLPHWEPIFLYGIHTLGCTGEMLADVLTFNPQKAGNSSEIGRAKWSGPQYADHPCPKPLPLYARLVRTLCPSAGPVIDAFAGSGTTLRAAKDLGKQAIGIEIEERYCEIAGERLSQEVLDFGAAA